MAKRKIAYNKSEYPNSFKRQGAFPLDETSVKYSKEDLDTYAKSNDAGAYVGQIVTVVPSTKPSNEDVAVEAETYVIYSEGGKVNRLVKESELLALDATSSVDKTEDNLQYIATISQADGKITASHKTLTAGDNISIKAAKDSGTTTIANTAAYAHSSTDADTSTSNLEYITEVTQSKGQISAKKKTLSGTANNISVTTDANGNTTIKDIAKYEHSSTKVDTTANNLEYLVEVTQADGTIAAKKKTLQGTASNISITADKDGNTTVKDIASYTDAAVDNKYVSEVDQTDGTISVSRRTLLEATATETANDASTQTTNGSVVVLTSMVTPATTSCTNKGIIPKNRTIKGDKDISVTVEKNSSDITVQHTTSVTAKTATSQTANGTKLTNGGTFTISDVQYNAQGHVSGEISATLTLPQYNSGTGIQVNADTTTTLSNDYKVNLQTATTSTIGGVKIHKDTTGYAVTAKTSDTLSADVSGDDHYRAVEIDKNDKAFTYIETADNDTYGIAKLHDSNECTSYTSDAGGAATPAAVRKAVPAFESATGIRAGASGTTTNSTTDVSDPYVKIIDNQKVFSSAEEASTLTPTYREQIQLKGGASTSITAKSGVITIADTATLADTAVANKYVSEVDQTNGLISVSRNTILETTSTETTKSIANGSVEVITSMTTPTNSKGIIPNKRKIKGAKDIEVLVDTSSSDITVQHSNSVTAKTTYSDISTNDSAQVNIVTPKYNAQGHVTGTADQKLTVGAASTTKLGTVRAGFTDSGANIKLKVESDGDAYSTLTDTAIETALNGDLILQPKSGTDEGGQIQLLPSTTDAFKDNTGVIIDTAHGDLRVFGHGGDDAGNLLLIDPYDATVGGASDNEKTYTFSGSFALPDSIKNKYTGKTVGGVNANTQITDTSVEDLLKRILGIKDGVAPSEFSFSLSPSSVTLDLNATSQSVSASWSVSKGTYTDKFTPTIGGISGSVTSSTSGKISGISITGISAATTSKSVSGSLSHEAGTGFSANTLTSNSSLTINRNCYSGASPSSLTPIACTSRTSLSYSGSAASRPTFQYPQVWGACTIYDANGYDVTKLFTRTDIIKNGGIYYQYTLTTAVNDTVSYTIS